MFSIFFSQLRVRKREREGEREGERMTEAHTDTDTDTGTQTHAQFRVAGFERLRSQWSITPNPFLPR
jgi:hypothetical protein